MEVNKKEDSFRLLGEILIKCTETMKDDDRLNEYASPCCTCGLCDDLNFELYQSYADLDYFAHGKFIIPIKPCAILRELAEQLFENNRLFMEG